jgi:PAS domain S-box-containing protein
VEGESDSVKEPSHRTEVEGSTDYREILYRRYFQGALVRSGASAAMWFFALFAFLANGIRINHFIGITFSVVYLILINPPTLLLLKRITQMHLYKYPSLVINFLEILGYTAIIYFLGGIEATFLTPIYAALITYVGVVSPRSYPFIISTLCSAAFSFVVVSEYFGFLPHQRVVLSYDPPLLTQLANLSVVIGLLFVVAYVSSLTGSILKKSRNKLREKNLELIEKNISLEEAEKGLREAHQNLEKMVEERTTELKKTIGQLNSEVKERKVVEEVLRESEEQYRLSFTNVSDVIYTIDTNLVLSSVSPGVERLLGYKVEELVHRPMQELNLIAPEYMKKAISETIRIFSGENIVNSVYEFIAKDGTRKIGEISGSPLYKDNKIIGSIAVARDITERKRIEEILIRKTEELTRSNKELEAFAYVASHDLQEPLRMVTSYVQLIEQRYKDKLDKDANEFIEFAVDGAKRMHLLINDLLTYSRVATRGKPLVPTDSETVLEQSLTNLQLAIQEKGAQITHDPLPKVMADDVQLGQLFQNLVGNAIKFQGNEQPRVHISVQQSNGEWVFSVRDNGIGIDPEFRERIFVIFQRLHGKDKYPGTGIGLAVCKKIVERHGGCIWVESELGKGATFYFTLPVVGEQGVCG